MSTEQFQGIYIRERNFTGSAREADLPIVPFGSQKQHNLGDREGTILSSCFRRRDGRRLPLRLGTPGKIRELQRERCEKAKQEQPAKATERS